MNPKFKVGDKVSLIHKKKKVYGVVLIRDLRDKYWEKKQYTYDVDCELSETTLIKHIPENNLELVNNS